MTSREFLEPQFPLLRGTHTTSYGENKRGSQVENGL
jgi:hypothetical protein